MRIPGIFIFEIIPVKACPSVIGLSSSLSGQQNLTSLNRTQNYQDPRHVEALAQGSVSILSNNFGRNFLS
jgi:hypothetical protein